MSADIGANLLDPMFQGIYHGKQAHSPDMDLVLQRAFDPSFGMLDSVIITAGTLQEAHSALAMAQKHGVKDILSPSRFLLIFNFPPLSFPF